MLSVNVPFCALNYTTRKLSASSPPSSNAYPQFPDMMKSFPKPTTRPSPSRIAISPLPRKESEQEWRRQVFLTKVRQAGDNQKWQSRSDQILRADFVARRKRWEKEKAISASEMLMVREDEEMEVRLGSSGSREDIEIMDTILQHEDRDFDALVSLLEESSKTTEQKEMAEYGSEDEEFAWLCLEAVAATEASDTNPPQRSLQTCDDMDTSTG